MSEIIAQIEEAERFLNETIKKEGFLYSTQVCEALGFECRHVGAAGILHTDGEVKKLLF